LGNLIPVNLKAYIYLAITVLSVPLVAICIKQVTGDLNNDSIVFYRHLFGFISLMPLIFIYGMEIFKTNNLKYNIARAVVTSLAIWLYFLTLSNISLGLAGLLQLCSPIFLPLAALIILKIRETKTAIALQLIAFIGAVLASMPDNEDDIKNLFTMDTDLIFVFAGLLSAILGAFSMIMAKKLSNHDSPMQVMMFFSVSLTIISGFWVVINGNLQIPSMEHIIYFTIGGCIANFSQIWAIKSLQYFSSANYGLFMFCSIPVSYISGYFIYSEIYSPLSIFGMAIIIIVAMASVIRNNKE